MQDEAGRVPVLGGGRLTLRPVRRGDAGAIRRHADDVEVSRWLSRVPHPYTAADAAQFVEEIAPREPVWAVALGDGTLVGVGGFAPRWHPTDMEFGYWIGRPFWGAGLATEAGALMLAEAWRRGARSVGAGCFDGNARSARVLDKLGFRAVGRSARPCLALGREVPGTDLRLDWPAGAG